MTNRRHFRQMLIGLAVLPLSVLPFLAYLSWTPEGRLVRDRALVAVNPPVLPDASAAEVRRGAVPAYEGAVMALAYHGIGSASDGEGGFALSAQRFGEHLVALRAAGMNTVTAAEVAAAFGGGKPLPPRAVMITFDDGRSDAMMFADPLLEQAGMKATMFVITGAAQDPGLYYAGWDRLKDASASGRWDLQSHTDALHDTQRVGGRDLPLMTSTRKGESIEGLRARVDRDLARANRALAEETGKKPVALAYPFGAYGADRTNKSGIRSAVRDVVADRYAVAFQQDEQSRMTLATPFDERTALRRLEVGDWDGAQLMRRIAGAADRTARALADREAELRAQVGEGAPIPSGLVESPAPAQSGVERSATRLTTPPQRTPAANRPTESRPAAPTAAPAPTPQPSPPSPSPTSPPTTARPSPPSTAPPATSPPTTKANQNQPTSPGKSDEPHGNGKNKDN